MHRVFGWGLVATLLALLVSWVIAAASAAAAPVGASMTLSVSGAFTVTGGPVTVVGRAVLVRGTVSPDLAGQTVTVTASVRGRPFLTRRVALAPAATAGSFHLSLASPAAGEVSVVATVTAGSQSPDPSVTRRFAALAPVARLGATGRFVVLVQQRLAALHIHLRQSGVFDQGTGLALDAYHRLLRWGHSQALDHSTVVWLLNGWGAFPVRYPGDGHHAEGNLGLQLLALVDRGRVQSIYPISSGKPSTPTILGRFRVYRKVPGYLPDGMYYSSFFIRGYAIHGYNPAPDYPASHGCMRLPIADAISVYDWLAIGNRVDVYY